ncbi:MAG: glycosyltransferase, partial [Chloroflexi bacterium]|nr:glycosyltransferase [Chloroflexota bacterium]
EAHNSNQDRETRQDGEGNVQGSGLADAPTPNPQHPTPNPQHPTPNPQPPIPNTQQSLRILHVITSLDVGGAQKHLLSLVNGLRRRGHQADVAFFKNPSLLPAFRATGATIFDLSTRNTLSATPLPRLALLLKRDGYQIIHTHLLKADVYGALAGVLVGTPVRIASKHNDERALLNPMVGRVHGLVSRLDHRVVVLSDYVGRYIADVGRVAPNRVQRIYYGLPPASAASPEHGASVRSELRIPPEAPLVGTVGRLAEQKGLTYLLEAMALVRREL